MITVHRLYHFCASHRLHVAAFDEHQNDELFGKCNNAFGHGHNYSVEVSVDGEVDPVTGRAVDLNQLDRLITEQVVSRYDHRYVNEECPEFAELVPTTENLGAVMRERLNAAWPAAFPSGALRLRRIRIFETSRNIIEVDTR